MTQKTNLLLLLALLPVLVVSCKKNSNRPDKGPGKPLVLTSAEQQLSAAGNTFNFKLFKAVAGSGAGTLNIFMSPLSVGFALGMTSNGANGATLDSIKSTLGFKGYTQDQINTYYNKLLTDLPQLDPNTTLKIANSIWYRNDVNVLPAFLQANNQYYQAKIQALNFNDPGSGEVINSWVSEQTNGKIPVIVGQIPSSTLMYLINAIYFKSIWKEKFDAAGTHLSAFYRNDNSTVQASFMTGNFNFNTYSDTYATVAELPYANSRYSMVIVMPRGQNNLSELVASLNADKWQTWMKGLTSTRQEISLPKFTYSYEADLKNTLASLGMSNAFNDLADFSKLSNSKVSISDVKHKAFVLVDESGTEAAAATSVSIGITALSGTIINHPFLFAIREMNTGLILFTGLVNDPTMAGN